MEYLKYLFARYDYLEVGDSFINVWSFDMMIFLSIVFLILIIIFRFNSKKKAIQILKEYYPDEEVISILRLPLLFEIFIALFCSFIYSYMILPNLFFQNLPAGYTRADTLLADILLIGFTILFTIGCPIMNNGMHLYASKSVKYVLPNKFVRKMFFCKKPIRTILLYKDIYDYRFDFYRFIFSKKDKKSDLRYILYNFMDEEKITQAIEKAREVNRGENGSPEM